MTGTSRSHHKLSRYCVICGTILTGFVSYLFRLAGINRSPHNPNICNRCNTHVEEGRIVKMTVLFADISSFTEMTQELGPERTHEVTDAFLTMATNTLVKHDAYIDKYIGDAVMAFFNVPIQRADHASNAVASALEIDAGISRLQEQFGPDIKAGIGIATGWARVGRIGSMFRQDYTAIGDVVNMAARLEGQAQPGEILIHSGVYEEVAADFPDLPSESLWLKGFREPVLTYYLRSESIQRPIAPAETGNRYSSPVALGAVLFALLGAPCAAVVIVGPAATAVGAGMLFGAITSQWMFFDADVIRIPLLVLATLGSLSIFYTVWHARRTRLQALGKGGEIALSGSERSRTVIAISLAVMTLIVVALSIAVHNFHFLMPGY